MPRLNRQMIEDSSFAPGENTPPYPGGTGTEDVMDDDSGIPES